MKQDRNQKEDQEEEEENKTKRGMKSEFIHTQLDQLESVRKEIEEASGLFGRQFYPQCDDCFASEDHQDAISRCLNCRRNFCETHQHWHDRQSKDHNMIDVSDVVDDSLNRLLDPFDVPPLELSEASREKRDQVLCLMEEMKSRRQDIETSLDLIGMMETDIQTSNQTQKDRIIRFTDTIKQEIERQIEERKENLLQQLEEKSKEKLDRLAQQRKQLERDLDSLDNSVSFSRSLIANATDHQFFSHLPLVVDQLNRFKEEKSFHQPPIVTTHLEMFHNVKRTIDLTDFLKGVQLGEKRSEDIIQSLKRTKRSLVTRIVANPRDFQSIGSPKLVFGSQGNRPGQFDYPCGVTINQQNNNIIVCDTSNHRIQVFDDQGKHLTSFGSKGSSNGQFNCPCGVVMDHFNNIIVCDTNNHRIQMFDDQGNHLMSFGSKGSDSGLFERPEGVTINHNNDIIVCDTANHRIQMFDQHGNHIRSFGSRGHHSGQFQSLVGVTVDHNNNIIVCDTNNHRIQIFDDEGNHLKSFGSGGSAAGLFHDPQGVAVDHHNNIVVCDSFNHRIQIFDDRGNRIKHFGPQGSDPGQSSFPSRVAVDRNNNIIVCDANNCRIQVF